MAKNVYTPTSKDYCSGWSVADDLLGSKIMMKFFNMNLDRKFQNNLGSAQDKTVK